MNTIRVLHVIGIMNRGGAEAMIMNLYRQIDRSIIQFDFVENDSGRVAAYDEEIEQLGGRIYRCPPYKGINHSKYVKWWKDFFKIHKEEYKIVHGHIGSTASIYLGVAKKYGLVTIAHSHNTNGKLSAKEFLYRSLAYKTRYIADYLFACSIPAGKDRYGNQFDISKSNCKVFYNAIDTKQFAYNPDSRNEIRRELNVDEGVMLIGHVGRFERAKNHLFLIRIFQSLIKKNANVRLMLVGDGSLKGAIIDECTKWNILEKVIFTGVRSDVSRYMSAMDVFVFPSLYEGLPVSLVEAQTSGLPCVISDHVPKDSVLVEELVSYLQLEDDPDIWSSKILEVSNTSRKNRTEEIKASGFDIMDTAAWLEEFYIHVSNSK